MILLKLVLEALSALMAVLMLTLLVYHVFLGFFGYRKKTNYYQSHDPRSRFLILVPAHNEEKVIFDMINNLNQLDYPRDLVQYYIIADNCTDRTLDIVQSMSGNVIITQKDHKDSPTGKPIAIKKALNTIPDYEQKYDLLLILDADNLLDSNLLKEINSQYIDQGYPEIIQCYLGSKNKSGMIAWFYYTSFTVSNRFCQLARTRLGLNCGIGGTGYAISTVYLHSRGGWSTMSLTEDFELQIEATLDGKRIIWNHNTRVYDEKPTSFEVSLRQRIRWAQGQWYVVFKNTPRLVSAIRKRIIKPKEALSVFMYMYGLFANVFAIFQLILGGIAIISGWYIINPQPLYITVYQVAIFLYCFIWLFYVADMRDNHQKIKIKSLTAMFVSIIVNLFIAIIAQFIGLIFHRRQNVWYKTDHRIHKHHKMNVVNDESGYNL